MAIPKRDNLSYKRARVAIITHASVGSRQGNRVTAERWKAIIERLGFDVSIVDRYDSEDMDVVVAIHAGRHTDSIRRFKSRYPDRRLIVAITGTDIYTSEFERENVQTALTLV